MMRLEYVDAQLNTLVNTESRKSMIDSGLGYLIGLVADKGMGGEKLNKLNNNIDDIKF